MSKTIIAIDIGKKGAILARVGIQGGQDGFYPMPMIKDEVDYNELWSILKSYDNFNPLIIFEKLGVIFGTS